MGSAETSDFLEDTELELDSLGTIALEGGTSSGGAIERAVDGGYTVSEIVSEKKLGQREK